LTTKKAVSLLVLIAASFVSRNDTDPLKNSKAASVKQHLNRIFILNDQLWVSGNLVVPDPVYERDE
jgi:hypothetical protein